MSQQLNIMRKVEVFLDPETNRIDSIYYKNTKLNKHIYDDTRYCFIKEGKYRVIERTFLINEKI